MRTDVKIGLFIGILLLVVAGWWLWREPEPQDRPVPVTAISDDDRPATRTPRTAERPAPRRPATPRIEPLPEPAPEPAVTEAPAEPVEPMTPAEPLPEPGPTATVEPVEPPVADLPLIEPVEPTETAPALPPVAGTPEPAPAPQATAERAGPPAIGREALVHVARAGDTFDSIARFYYDDARFAYVLREANPNVTRLLPGAAVRVPDLPPGAVPRAAAAAGGPAPASPGTLTMGGRPAAAGPATRPATGAAQAGGRDYRVQRGDTLWGIAARELGAGNRYREILELNADTLGGRPEGLRAGQVLRLPPR